jgi:hypothetical protein
MSGKQYRVIGKRNVAGVAPGGLVDHAELVRRKARINLLLGLHLEKLEDAPAPAGQNESEDA